MKLVYAYYCLDIIHTGHLLAMKNAKELAGEGGKLVIGILTNAAVEEKKRPPILDFREMMYIAKCLKFPDLVVAQDTYSNIGNLLRFKPEIIVESDSHDEEHIRKVENIVKQWGGRIVVLPYYPEESSTNIKNKIKEDVYDD
jgi:phosphoenolpyruvate phosphomutase / 2-hydroxyethylphosphonate cytidylyltransferase